MVGGRLCTWRFLDYLLASPSPIKRPLRNSRAWGWDTPPIPLLRPFDSAHATAHLRQGERNASPPGMERPYFVSGFGGRNDGYANETHQRAPKADVWLIKRPVRDYPFGAILARLDMLSNPELPALDSRLSAYFDRLGGWHYGAPPARPFDSAQGERPPHGDAFRLGGRNDRICKCQASAHLRLIERRLRNCRSHLWCHPDHLTSLPPLILRRAQHERPRPLRTGYAKVSSR